MSMVDTTFWDSRTPWHRCSAEHSFLPLGQEPMRPTGVIDAIDERSSRCCLTFKKQASFLFPAEPHKNLRSTTMPPHNALAQMDSRFRQLRSQPNVADLRCDERLEVSAQRSLDMVVQFAVVEWPFRGVAEALVSTERCAVDYYAARRALLVDVRDAIAQSREMIERISGAADVVADKGPFDLAEAAIRELGTALIEAQVRAVNAMRPIHPTCRAKTVVPNSKPSMDPADLAGPIRERSSQ